MTDDIGEADDERDGLEAADDEIEEEPGSGMGPASDMEKAEDAEEENRDEE